MDKIDIVKVSSEEELKKVYQIRTTVFVEEQSCPAELEWENEDVSTHFLAKFNNEPAGACRWRETEKGFKLERFAVLPQFRGKGIASKMIATLIADLPQKANYVYLHAQVSAMPLYAKAKFKPIGDMFEEAGIQHYKMVLDRN
jgi:predicted GNAT family N-acyltransferase